MQSWFRERRAAFEPRVLVHLVIAVGVPSVVVGVFLFGAFRVERVREGVGRVAPYMTLALYAAVGGLLLLQLVKRFVRVDARWSRGVSVAPFALAGAVLAYLVPLVDKWENGRRAYSAVGGVVPYSDARGYYIGALDLLFDGDLSGFNSRRPLNVAFLTFRLAVTNLDLRSALVIQAVLLGVASYLAARAVARDLGPVAGMALFAGIFGFASFGVETTLSESLGTTLGALALATLWTAVRNQSLWLAAAGLFLLAWALNARAGTVLLLLAVPIFLAWRFRGSARFSGKALAVTLGAVTVALAMNVFLVVLLNGTPSNLNTNANQSFYGLAKGNEGWRAIYRDYPELREMPSSEANRFIREKTIQEILDHPGRFALGLTRSGGDYVTSARQLIAAPIRQPAVKRLLAAGALVAGVMLLGRRWRASPRAVVVDIVLFGGLLLAIPVLFGVWRTGDHALYRVTGSHAHYQTWLPLVVVGAGYLAFIIRGTARLASSSWTFVAVGLVGIGASLPLVPIRDAGPRVYAATTPFFALALAGAAAIFCRWLAGAGSPLPSSPPARSKEGVVAPVAVGGAILVAAIVGAPVAMTTVSMPEVRPPTCADGGPAEAFAGGTAVHLVANDEPADQLDELRLERFSVSYLEIAPLVRGVPAGTTLLQALPVSSSSSAFNIAVVDGSVDPPGRSVLYLCGDVVEEPTYGSRVFMGTPIDP